MENMKKIFLLLFVVYSIILTASGQDNKIYSNMSMDELLNIDVVVTASKQPEDLFEAPLSVTIIKREDIEKSGASCIPEALRLAPGLIVREITPGNYDVHIRGYDDITKNVYITLPYNTTTLVMIDNRIVYNYFTGGTLWETFPIDINDVQQIEVVRGPASALYGPNAVTGVINIITTHSNKTGMNVLANGTAGTNQAKNFNTSIGYNWNDQTKLTFTGNFTERHRFDDGYFNFNKGSYTSRDQLSMTISPVKDITTHESWSYDEYVAKLGASYDEGLSLRKLGGNVYFNHRISELSSIDIAIGAQKSQSQKTGFLNMVTPLSQIESASYYLNARMKHKNWSGQFDVYSGHDFSNYKFNSYKFTNIDANLEYFKQFNKLSFRPGISYKSASYNSPLTYQEPMKLSILNFQFKDDPRIAITYSASLLTEWNPTSKLRVIGATRLDKTSINTNLSFNYEVASTFRLNKNNLFRYAYSRASRSAFLFDSYMNCNISLNFDYQNKGNKVPISVPVEFNILGQQNLKYPTITNHEIGWRTKIMPNLSMDVEVFYSKVKNLVNPNSYRKTETVQHLSPSFEPDSIVSIKAVGNVIFENYDLNAQQFGTSFSFNYDHSEKLNFRLYGTYQKTTISGHTNADFVTTKLEVIELPDNKLLIKEESKQNPTQWTENLTPSFFGGFTVNFKPTTKWNLNTEGYYYSKQEFENFDSSYATNNSNGKFVKTVMHIHENIVLNAKASYRVNNKLTPYLMVKNIMGNHREYGFADQIGRQFLIGIRWEL
jgi:iron complex outermembrane recepter protein